MPDDLAGEISQLDSLVDASTVLEKFPMPAFVLGPDHTLVGYNYGFAELTGIGEEEKLGEDYRDVVSETIYADGRRELSLADKVVESPWSANVEYDVERVDRDNDYTRDMVYRDTSTMKNRRGEEIDIAFIATPVLDDDGDLVAVLELTNEIDPDLEDFPGLAGMLSHDLRNPLNVIQTYVELSREDLPDKHFRKIQSSINRMDRLMSDVMELAETREHDVTIEEVRLDRVARGAWRYIDCPAATLEVEHAVIETDSSHIQQIFENLLRNCVEHAGPDVRIQVGPGTDCIFYVADDGPGIPAHNRDQVFERGYTNSNEGTGLGLTIVDHLVSDHGWEIAVTESASGGARFEISDPYHDADED